jgi:3'-phosphoadenosine 5'-phosphosulfate sulfotransferase (PAPS reductase)/FAD synthetase
MTVGTDHIQTLIDRGALFVVNHSGGKDSQAMYLTLRKLVPENQLLVIHAHLPEIEWSGTIDHIRSTIDGAPFHIVSAAKTFFDMVEHRGMFPSPSHRQCTSDLKRAPIETFIRRELKRRGLFLIVNCLGLRAEESPSRAKKITFKSVPRCSKAGREWYEWLPIHHLKVAEVFQIIHDNGQTPHWAYSKGMSRLSCCFCIMASKADLRIAAELNPELYDRYVATEKRLGFSLQMPSKGTTQYLDEITGIPANLNSVTEAPEAPMQGVGA